MFAQRIRHLIDRAQQRGLDRLEIVHGDGDGSADRPTVIDSSRPGNESSALAGTMPDWSRKAGAAGGPTADSGQPGAVPAEEFTRGYGRIGK